VYSRTDRADDQPQPNPRSRKIYVLWGIAISTLVALGLVCWLVVVPVLEVRSFVQDPGSSEKPMDELLGGEKRAAERLAAYARMPSWIVPQQDRWSSVLLLSNCGESGLRECGRLLSDEDPEMRKQGMAVILAMAPDHDLGVVKLDLLHALEHDPSSKIKRWASEVLGRWMEVDSQLLSELKRMTRQDDEDTKGYATVALNGAKKRLAEEQED